MAQTVHRGDDQASTMDPRAPLQMESLTGLLIEPRNLKNVVPLVHNFYAVLGDRSIPLHFYCGKGLVEKWRERLADFTGVQYFELPVNNLRSNEYSDFLKNPTLWATFQTAFVLTIQTDGCLAARSPWKIRDFMCYDFVGGYAREGWWWKETQGLHDPKSPQCFNGGFSLRNVAACRDVVTTFPPSASQDFRPGQDWTQYAEDMYFVVGLLRLKRQVALNSHGTNFCSHTSLVPGSFAIHKIDIYGGGCHLPGTLAYCPEFAAFVDSATHNTF